tara:strand:- start:1539 stop:2093 length:555 start_codon:yes stop_codon:yes gene_type:complete
MAEERLDLRKEVFDKAQYVKTINTSFNELGVETLTEELQTQPTVSEFFGLYNTLFYDIPALGDTNSHQYLVRTSGDYINFDQINEEVEALQAEIAQLRSDLLQAQMANIRVAASASNSPETDNTLAELESELVSANQALIDAAAGASQDAASDYDIDITLGGGSSAGEGGTVSGDAPGSGYGGD